MLAWVVTYRRHLRHSTPISSSLRTQRLCVKLSDSFPPAFSFASHLPYLLPSSVSCNSFVCHSYENCLGVYQQFPFWNSPLITQTHCSSSFFSNPCALFCSFLHLCKTQVFSFQAIPHSASKKKTTTSVSVPPPRPLTPS